MDTIGKKGTRKNIEKRNNYKEKILDDLKKSIEVIKKRWNYSIISGATYQKETMKKTLNREIKKACRKNENNRIMRICAKLEGHANKNRIDK